MLVLQIAINVASLSVGQVGAVDRVSGVQTREQARFLICSDTQTFAEDRRMVNFNGCKIYNRARDFGVKVNDPHHSLGRRPGRTGLCPRSLRPAGAAIDPTKVIVTSSHAPSWFASCSRGRPKWRRRVFPSTIGGMTRK
jgi:hypothetical protein